MPCFQSKPGFTCFSRISHNLTTECIMMHFSMLFVCIQLTKSLKVTSLYIDPTNEHVFIFNFVLYVRLFLKLSGVSLISQTTRIIQLHRYILLFRITKIECQVHCRTLIQLRFVYTCNISRLCAIHNTWCMEPYFQ